MINFYDLVPMVYTSTSRDFQYLSWLINIVLNSVKHNVDTMYDLPNTKFDSRLTELLAITLGFKVKRNYNQKQLLALTEVLPKILKYKGTLEAVRLAGEALIAAADVSGAFSSEIKDGTLIVCLPKDLIDITLFVDLLPYILPAGIPCHIMRKTEIKAPTMKIDIQQDDRLLASFYQELDHNPDTHEILGLARLFDIDNQKASLTNMTIVETTAETIAEESSTDLVINSGLMSNTIIPSLPQSRVTDTEEVK